jgi:hypothetical protein
LQVVLVNAPSSKLPFGTIFAAVAAPLARQTTIAVRHLRVDDMVALLIILVVLNNRFLLGETSAKGWHVLLR